MLLRPFQMSLERRPALYCSVPEHRAAGTEGHFVVTPRPPVSVPPGGAVVTEFKTHVPGAYSIVDHALSRAERGLADILYVEGAPTPDILNSASPQPAHLQ